MRANRHALTAGRDPLAAGRRRLTAGGCWLIALLLPPFAAAAAPVYHLAELRAESLAVAPPWREGERLSDPEAARADSRRWLAAMDRAGYPFAQVWTRPLEARGDTLDFAASFLAGPSGPLGELRVRGGERLSENFLEQLLRLPRDRPLGLQDARAGAERLEGTGWFAEVAEPELGWDPVDGRVGVLYRVRERPRQNRAALLLGGGSGQRYGTADLSLFSPFGGGRSWDLSGDWQSDARSRVLVELREPRVLGRPLDLGLRFFRSLQDSTWLRQSLDLDLELPLPGGWRGRVAYGFERTLFPQVDGEISRRRQGIGLRWRGASAAGPRDLRLDTDLLLRRDEGPERQQWELSGQARWSRSLVGDLKIRLRAGGTWLHTGTFLSEAELYGLGGARSLRGWDEEHFRGDRVGSASLELALGSELELAAFLDYGLGRRNAPGQRLRFSGWGYGVGLRTPGRRGGLVLDLALGEGRSISDLRVHLMLETGF